MDYISLFLFVLMYYIHKIAKPCYGLSTYHVEGIEFMRQIIAHFENYEVLKVNDGYIVKNIDMGYSNHAHFDRCSGAMKCLELIKKRRYPKSEYFQIAFDRLLSKDELNRLTYSKRKEKYVNRR